MALIDKLPDFYANSKEVKQIIESDEKELLLLIETLEDLRNQFYINTATWGLTYYEEDLGIKVDINKPYDERREAIKAKMRGQGTTTIQMLKDTSMAFTGGNIEVVEDYTNYKFTIKFIDALGTPRNIEDFKSMIDTIKPAHLAYAIEYLYNTWNMVKAKTWNDVKTLTWQQIRDTKL